MINDIDTGMVLKIHGFKQFGISHPGASSSRTSKASRDRTFRLRLLKWKGENVAVLEAEWE